MNVKDLKKLAVVMLLFLAIVYVYYYKNDKNYFNSFDKSYNLRILIF